MTKTILTLAALLVFESIVIRPSHAEMTISGGSVHHEIGADSTKINARQKFNKKNPKGSENFNLLNIKESQPSKTKPKLPTETVEW